MSTTVKKIASAGSRTTSSSGSGGAQLAIDECLHSCGEFFLFEAADVYIYRSVVVDESKGWLIKDIEFSPDDAIYIDEVFKVGNEVVVNEGFHRGNVLGSARKADEGDLVTEFFLHRCDRRGFCSAAYSPGSPEPDDHVLALEVIRVELGAADGVADQRWKAGSASRWRRFGGLCRRSIGVTGGYFLCWRSGTCRRKECDTDTGSADT